MILELLRAMNLKVIPFSNNIYLEYAGDSFYYCYDFIWAKLDMESTKHDFHKEVNVCYMSSFA